MAEEIVAYIVGRINLGPRLKNSDPEKTAKYLIKTFKEIKEVNIITGEWNLLVKFEVNSMEEYHHVAWGIAKHLERGWGALVSKKIKR